MNKPIKHSVAIVVRNQSGGFLVVKRADDDASLPGVWALPAASLTLDETSEAAAVRAGRIKLGVGVEVLRCTGEDEIDKGTHITHLREYEAKIIEGQPSVPQFDTSVSQYVEMKFTRDPTILTEAAQKGSLCSRIFLRNQNVAW